jgi:hypothetical protein
VNRNNTLTGQTGDLDWLDRCTPEPRNVSKPPENLLNAYSTLTGQTGDLDWLDRCTPEPRNVSKPPENLLNASSKPFQAQTSPPCSQCMNQAKNAKLST